MTAISLILTLMKSMILSNHLKRQIMQMIRNKLHVLMIRSLV